VSFEQGEDALLLMVEMTTKDLAELTRGGRHADTALEGGVDRFDRCRQAAVLLDHEVELVDVLVVGQMASQHGPQIVVLGGVVHVKGLTERGPALRHGFWHTAWVLELRGEGFQAGRVAAQPGVDGTHEAEVGRAVVIAGLVSSPDPPSGEHRQAGRDNQEQRPRRASA